MHKCAEERSNANRKRLSNLIDIDLHLLKNGMRINQEIDLKLSLIRIKLLIKCELHFQKRKNNKLVVP